jgi:hypothetical protein
MLSDAQLCPRRFVLEPDPSLGPARDCEVVWRRRDRLGVRFIG